MIITNKMNYSLYLIVLFLVLFIVYWIVKFRESNLQVVRFEPFGSESSNYQLNKKQKDKIIGQKITHRNIAFYTYWLSLIVSFGLGGYAIFKIIQGMDFKWLHDAFSISAGVVSTISFRKLYIKCDKDLNNLK